MPRTVPAADFTSSGSPATRRRSSPRRPEHVSRNPSFVVSREIKMANHEIDRRQFLFTAAGVAVFPRLIWAAAPSYDPGAKFEISVSDVDMRKNAAGRMLKARVYRPNGPGPFPAILDLHG